MTRSAKSLLRDAAVIALAGLTLGSCSLSGRQAPRSASVVEASPTPVVPAAPAPQPRVDDGDPDVRFRAALALMNDQQPKAAQDALAALAALTKDFPAFSGPLTDLGILLARGKQRPLAIATFQKAVKANPDNVVAYNWLGTLYRENGDLRAAQTAYQKAIALRADYAAPHLNLGILYDAYLRRPQDALAEYREYQRLSGADRLIVSAWIRELEAVASTVAPTAAPNPAERN